MDNPFHKLKEEIENLRDDVTRRVKTAICRETIEWNLSRLKDLDPERAETYRQMATLLDEAR